MPVDRGGLNYNIEVVDNFSTNLAAFKKGLEEARAEFAAFKSDAKGLREATAGMAKVAGESAKAAGKMAEAERKRASAVREGTKELSIREKAERKYAKAVEDAAIKREFANVAEERSFRLMRRSATAQETQAAAAKKLTAVLDKRAATEALLAEVQARGAKLTDKELSRLGLLTAEQTRLVRAKERLAAATDLATNAELRNLRVQERASSIKSRGIEQAEIEKILLAQGLDRNGRPLKAPATLADRANAIKAKAVDREALRGILAAQGLGLDGKALPVPKTTKDLAEGIKAAAARKDEIRSLLAAQGLAPDGRPLKASPTLADRAKQIKDVAAQRESLRLMLAADGLDINGKPLPKPVTIEDRAKSLVTAAANKSALVSLLKAQGYDATGKPLPPPPSFKQRVQDLLGLSTNADKAERSVRTLAGSVSKLVGAFVLFRLLKSAVTGMQVLLREMVRFNAQIETAQLGIASLFTAVGEVRDATGQTVTASQALAVAQKEAARQTQLLRKDALLTASSFENLLATFQTAIAPGLTAGLNVDQIRQFTVQISQAANAIGLEQNQLAEEIRSILQGTIQVRTTRIATSLGITNEDIKRAKELGVLAEFLQNRFAAFSVAGQESLKTFNAIYTNTLDAIRLVLASGSLKLFDALKGTLKEIFDLVTNTDPITGTLAPDPKVVAIIQAVSDGLTLALAEATKLGEALGFKTFQAAAEAFGTTIATAASIVRGIIQGIVSAYAALAAAFRATTDALGITKLLSGDSLATLVSLVVQAGILGKIVFSVSSGLLTIGRSVLEIGGGVAKILIGFSPVTLILLGIVGSLAVGVSLFKSWFDSVTGLNLKLVTVYKLIKEFIISSLTDTITLIGYLWDKFAASAKLALLVVQKTVIETATKATQAFLDILGKVSDVWKVAAIAFKEARNGDTTALNEAITLEAKRLELIEKQKQAMDEKNAVDTSKRIDEIIKGDATAPELPQILESILRDSVLPLFGKVKDSLTGSGQEATKLSKLFDELPGQISRAASGTQGLAELGQKLREDLEAAKDSLRETQTTLGLTGSALRQRQEILRTEISGRKELKLLVQQVSEVEGEQARIAREKLNVSRATSQLSKEEADQVSKGVALGTESLRLDREIAKAKSSVAIEIEAARAAQSKGDKKALEDAAFRKKIAEQILESIEKEKKALAEKADILLASAEPERAKELASIISQTIVLRGQEVGVMARLADLEKEKLRIQGELQAGLNLRIQALAQEAAFELRRQNVEQAVVTANIQREVAARKLSESERDLVLKQNELDLLKAQTEQSAKQREITILELEALKLRVTSAEALLAVEEQITQERQQSALLAVSDAAKIRAAEAERDEARIRATGSFKEQFQQISQEMNQELPNRYQILKETLQGVVSGFASFVSASIVSAFDPTSKTDIKERFGRFLQSIAQQMLDTLLRVAFTKKLLSLGLGFSDGGLIGGTPTVALAHGGRVRAPKSHRHYADGGTVVGPEAPDYARPKGLPASDKINAWLTRDEFVQPVHAVKTYGADLMEAFRSLSIDPMEARSLLRTSRRSSSRGGSSGFAFAEGGSVGNKAAAAQGSGGSGVTVAAIVANDAAMERLLHGGKAATIRFLEENGFTRR